MFEAEVTVKLKFRHYLDGFGGEFSRPHEHTWGVTVRLATSALDQRGVSVDFVELRENLAAMLEPYQGKLLNDCEAFSNMQPTAECIAIWVIERLGKTYPGLISSVSVGTAEECVRFVPETEK
jgi:6-pyruvoyltetrahydropterin/6-carboxytetrahydropterin synthase